ncbi:MAG TPA: rod shape-determining protein MreD [Candidatus Limnocylindrales bacterium]|nr:rod shape-determining protein MreD [Candidatus Limnocylindrales bacterium]
MSLPLAAVGAIVAALLETSLLPGLGGAVPKPDLVFAMTIVAAMMMGVEDGLTWAFLGGLMLDVLLAERALGATSMVLLVCAGLAIVAARLLPQRRVVLVAASVLVLSIVYQSLVLLVLSATTDLAMPGSPVAMMLPSALLDAALALPAAAAARWLWLRLGEHDRIEW